MAPGRFPQCLHARHAPPDLRPAGRQAGNRRGTGAGMRRWPQKNGPGPAVFRRWRLCCRRKNGYDRNCVLKGGASPVPGAAPDWFLLFSCLWMAFAAVPAGNQVTG
ncbi:hypothetical protein RA20_01980 [Leisingera sp. ANG-Vp]|nr:hypothetical protein RA20_01980 [Leisingera sp. ANG-Vp]